LRKQQTPAEAIFWELVRNRRLLGLKFRRQHQLGDYVADFYCHEHRLVIELDGGVHAAKRKKDHKRDAWMEAQGFTVLRFHNEELLDDPESVLRAIADVVAPIKAPPSPSGRRVGDEGVVESTAFDHLFPDRLVDSELGEIPEGWEVGRVDDAFDLTMGQSPPGTTYNEVGDGIPFYQGRADFKFRFPERRVYCTAPTRFAKAGDTLISVRAPVGDINMASEDCAIGRGVAAARHKTGARSYTYYFMHALAEVFGRFEAEGTVFGSISKKDFHNIPCVIVTRNALEAFERLCGPLDDAINGAERESRTLAALRDALLPKLISGELRLPAALRDRAAQAGVKDAEGFIGRTV
jgi:very-short-patch-repair endonuclease